jgi:hypothetical protein
MDKFKNIVKNSFLNAAGDDNFPLTVGSKGDNVVRLQNALNALGGNQIPTDGNFTSAVASKLTSLGLPSTIATQDAFDQIMAGSTIEDNGQNLLTEDKSLFTNPIAAIAGLKPTAVKSSKASSTSLILYGLLGVGAIIGIVVLIKHAKKTPITPIANVA